MAQILFIHDKCVWYRKPLFDMLARRHSPLFVFTNGKKVNDNFKAEHVILHRYGWHSFSFAFGLLPVLMREKCDLMILPPPDSAGELFDDFVCFIAARIRRKPYVVWVGKWGWKCDDTPLIRRLYQAIGQVFIGFIYRRAGACISYGTKHKEYLLSLNVGEKNIFIAPQASIARESKNSSSVEIEKDLGLDGKKVVLYVGRLIKRKGADYLIEAFAELRKERDDVHLLIIGGAGWYGKEEHINLDQLKKLLDDSGLRLNEDITFLGEIENRNLSKYYAIADVFVLPSVTYRLGEPWGLVLNEAMQFGKPVIATDAVGAAYDLIENGVNGFMVPEKNVEALHKALSRILSDPDKAERMGCESKRIIGKYTYERMFEGFEDAFNHVLRSNMKKY